MENTFIIWADFSGGLGREMRVASDVFERMKNDGLIDHSLTIMDFTFVAETKEKLTELVNFMKEHYPYFLEEIKEIDELWEVNGKTNEIPLTGDNMLYWALDMYKRGFEFDAQLDAYGSFVCGNDKKIPDLAVSKASFYFDEGIDCYDKGNLSGALFNWSLVIFLTPDDPNAYYSRAIVKNELYTWKAALADYDKALEIAPDFADALINRGTVKDENGDYIGAISDYQKALGLPDVETEIIQQAYFNLGNTRYNMNDREEACINWKKAYELGAEDAMDRINEFCKA